MSITDYLFGSDTPGLKSSAYDSSRDWFDPTRLLEGGGIGAIVGGVLGGLAGGWGAVPGAALGGAASGAVGEAAGMTAAEAGRRFLGLNETEAMAVDIIAGLMGGERFFTGVAQRGLGLVKHGAEATELFSDLGSAARPVDELFFASDMLAKGHKLGTAQLASLADSHPEIAGVLKRIADEQTRTGNVLSSTKQQFWDAVAPFVARTRTYLENSNAQGMRLLGHALDEKPIQQALLLDKWRPAVEKTGLYRLADDQLEQFNELMERHVRSAWIGKGSKGYSRNSNITIKQISNVKSRTTKVTDYDPEVFEVAKRMRVALDDIVDDAKGMRIKLPGTRESGKQIPFTIESYYLPHVTTNKGHSVQEVIRGHKFTELAEENYRKAEKLRAQKDTMLPDVYETKRQLLEEDTAVARIWAEADEFSRTVTRFGNRTTAFHAMTRQMKMPIKDIQAQAKKVSEHAKQVVADAHATPLKKAYWQQLSDNVKQYSEGLIVDPRKAMNEYMDEMASMLGAQRAWGPKFETLTNILGLIPEERHRNFATALIDQVRSPSRNLDQATVRFAAGTRAFTTMMSMALSAFTNWSQIAAPMSKFGPGKVFRAITQYASDPDVRHALRYGHLSYQHWHKEMLEGLSGAMHNATRQFLKYTGFTATEYMNRAVTNLAARLHFQSVLRNISAGKLAYSDAMWMKRAGVDMSKYFKKNTDGTISDQIADIFARVDAGDDVAKQMLTDDARRYALMMETRMQFNARPMDIPLNWNNPIMKLAMQFKTFALNQTGLMKDMFVIAAKAAKHGDIRGFEPLLRMATYLPMFGYAIRNVRDAVTGADWMSTKSEPEKLYQYFAAAGGIGLVSDIMASVSDPNFLLEFFAGPTAGQVGKFVAGVANWDTERMRKAFPTVSTLIGGAGQARKLGD